MGIASRIPGLKAFVMSFFQDTAPTNGATNKVPTVNAVYDAIAAAKAAVVQQTITDAVTDSAPSQNAVHDALVLKQDADISFLTFAGQGSAPATPASGHYVLYVLTADGKLYIKNSSGTATVIGTQS